MLWCVPTIFVTIRVSKRTTFAVSDADVIRIATFAVVATFKVNIETILFIAIANITRKAITGARSLTGEKMAESGESAHFKCKEKSFCF